MHAAAKVRACVWQEVCKGHEMRAAAKVRACMWQEDCKWRDMHEAANEQKNRKRRDMRAAANEQKNRKWRDMRTVATSKTETKQKKAPQKEPWTNMGSKGEECTMEVHVISHAEPNTCAQSAAEKKENFCENKRDTLLQGRYEKIKSSRGKYLAPKQTQQWIQGRGVPHNKARKIQSWARAKRSKDTCGRKSFHQQSNKK
eukprot:3156871-Ditylum_brightwellii.AAC.2